MKKFFAMAALAAVTVSVNAEVTPRSPIVPWGAQAEIIITNDLTQKNSDGSWTLTADAQQWIEYSYDGTTENGTIQQTNRPNVWFDFYSEAEGCDDMIITSAELNWGGYLTVTSKTGSTEGLIVVGKNRYPAFYVTGTDKAKFYFSGSAGTAGYPQIEVYEVGSETPVATYTGDFALTKKTWDHSTLLIADGLDKAKNYKIVARTMNADGAYEGGDIVLQVVKFYGDQAPMREDGLIISGSEIGSYINAHLAAYPEVTDFTLEGSGKYTIKEGITATGKFTLTGVASAPATIDASALAAPFVAMSDVLPETWTTIDAIQFANIKVTGLGQALFFSAVKNYLITNFAVDNSIIEVTKDVTVFDFTKGSVAVNINVNKSTLYATTTTAKSLYSSQSGQKASEAGEYTQTFKFYNNTIFNFAKSKNFFSHRQSNQTWLTYDVKSNIFMDCGKEGQVIKGMNGGQGGANPTWIIDSNTFLWSTTTTVDETETTEIANTAEKEETGDAEEPVQNSLTGVPFSAVPTNNFTVAANSQQAKYQTGDPRWLVTYATDAIKIEVDQENPDFVKMINDALQMSEAPSSITVTFFEYGTYGTTGEINTTSPIRFLLQDADEHSVVIRPSHSFTLGGSIEFNGIDVWADNLEAPFIILQGNPYKLQENGFYNFGNIKLNNMKVWDLSQDLIYGNKVKNLISEIETKNTQIYMTAEKKTVYNFNGGGVVQTLNFVNSTLDAAGSYFYSSQSGNKATEAGVSQQTFNISTSTIYRTAGKAFQHRQGGQTWLRYILKNSMIINPGKDNFVADMNAGQKSANPVWQVTGNAFQKITEEGTVDLSASQDNGDSEETIQNSITGTMAFTSLETPDFGGTFKLTGEATAPSSLGDPRWTITFDETTTGIKAMETVETIVNNGAVYNLNGQQVQTLTKGLYIQNGKKFIVK